MKAKNKAKQPSKKKAGVPGADKVSPPVYRLPFPRPVCLEKCTMNIPNGYAENILMTLKAFSSEVLFERKIPHKLEGSSGLWSLDVKSRNDKYRLLYFMQDGICKITNLCTTETH
ncbi:MAG: hypothetical protein LBK61_11050 [Spirochaetaceae bacterium]|jgi:hypothetical protein|nr:hypothetical protein [Spirochaetaceae bacterium]